MNEFPLPENEEKRLIKLAYHDLIGLAKDPSLDVFTETARLIADSPASFLSIMERDTQTVQSCVGIELDFIDRQNTVCQYAVQSGKTLIIKDTLEDERSSDNPLILASGIRFYAGIPLLDEEGLVLGTLCVIDYKPKTLSSSQISALEKLGAAVSRNLMDRVRYSNAEYFEQLFSVTNNLIGVMDYDFKIKKINPAFENAFCLKNEDVIGKSFSEVLKMRNADINLEEVDWTGGEHAVTTNFILKSCESAYIEWNFKRSKKQNKSFCFGRNITRLVNDKQKIERSEKRFRTFFENAIGLMSMHDMEGNILAVNEKGREILKYSLEETKKLNLRDLVPKNNLPLL
ncbi:PAS domain S-box protein [Chryseobacterium sp. 6424]|uniref:PAS domain S-box protein n=1 Tax=Chryseobacterium sp. 6424 TaxID=2039166 RepID=UPI001E62E54C|nr:PAS domain S-box protein [Chryseobacterium sp. 6424]